MPLELQSLEGSAELRAVTDSIRDYAIFLLDPSGRVLTWNTGARQLKGYAPGEIIGQSFHRFYTEEDRLAGRPQRLLRIAATEGRVEDEGWRVRKDGSHFWADVVLSAIFGAHGEVRGYVKVTRDLTDRRRVEEQLKQSEERLRLMIHSVKDYAIFLLDRGGHVVSWNSGAERLKGYSAGEIIGRHFSIFYPRDDVESGRPQRELEIAATTGRFEEEGFRLRKDGSRFWASVVLTAVRTPQGELVGFTKVTRDVTERKRAAQQLEERARQQTAISNLGLHALQTRELDEVVEAALRTIRESLQVEDVRLLRGGRDGRREPVRPVQHDDPPDSAERLGGGRQQAIVRADQDAVGRLDRDAPPVGADAGVDHTDVYGRRQVRDGLREHRGAPRHVGRRYQVRHVDDAYSWRDPGQHAVTGRHEAVRQAVVGGEGDPVVPRHVSEVSPS